MMVIGMLCCLRYMLETCVPVVYTVYKSYPFTDLGKPLGLYEVEAPEFLDSRHLKVVTLLAQRTGRLYPTVKMPGTHFC